jgi:methionyl-tRNA synthetase
LTWLETKDWKPNVVNFIKGYINDLRPRAITRDMTWGISIPLPNTEGKVLYGWFDAPIGYISATKEWESGTLEGLLVRSRDKIG